MYNYSKLLGVMREKGVTQEIIARKTGINAATLNKKLNNNSQFKQSEMQTILHCLGLPLDSVVVYFFTK